MSFIDKITKKRKIGLPRYVWHLHHIGIALLTTLILSLVIPDLYTTILIAEVFILGNKLALGHRSNFQTKSMYLKDMLTDWNQYQTAWILYFGLQGEVLFAFISLIAISIIYIATIDWAYP